MIVECQTKIVSTSIESVDLSLPPTLLYDHNVFWNALKTNYFQFEKVYTKHVSNICRQFWRWSGTWRRSPSPSSAWTRTRGTGSRCCPRRSSSSRTWRAAPVASPMGAIAAEPRTPKGPRRRGGPRPRKPVPASIPWMAASAESTSANSAAARKSTPSPRTSRRTNGRTRVTTQLSHLPQPLSFLGRTVWSFTIKNSTEEVVRITSVQFYTA